MSQLSAAHAAVNLVQGFPDFPSPPELREAAIQAIAADHNQYPHPSGQPRFREAIADKVARTYPGWKVDPEREICVMCGATEALMAACIALLDPGDEVIVFEPWYENYRPDPLLSDAIVRTVELHEPDWSIDETELRAAFGPRTKLVLICTPNNPTGKVFSRPELELIAQLCQHWGAHVISDEIYEHIQYLGEGGHVPCATVPGLEDRTVTINSLSKTYGVTGWRVGWSIAPSTLTEAITRLHEFMTIGAPTPFQEAGIAAMHMPPSYYKEIAADYKARRDVLCDALEEIGFRLRRPDGAYYVLCDTAELDPARDGYTFARHLITDIGVSSVPSVSFYRAENAEAGRSKLRFAFPKRLETLRAAIDRLWALRGGERVRA